MDLVLYMKLIVGSWNVHQNLGLDYNDNYGVHKMIYDSIKNSPKDY